VEAVHAGDFQEKNKIKIINPYSIVFFFLATNYSIVVTSVLHSFELQEFSRVLHIAVYEQGDIFCKQQNLSLFFENSCVSLQLPPRN
jgi:hypothetical protein